MKKFYKVATSIFFVICFVLIFKMDAKAATTIIDGIRWNYTIQDGNAVNVYCDSFPGNDFIIPDKINGYTVMSIGDGVNPINTTATNIVFLNRPIIINDYAFKDSNISSLVCLDNKIKSIGAHAFENSKIADLNIYDFTNEIKDNAFAYCIYLKRLYVPENIKLGNYVFKGCQYVKDIEIAYPELTNQFQDMIRLENIVLDESVNTIGAETFKVTCGKISKEEYPDKTNVELDETKIGAAAHNKKPYVPTTPEGEVRNWYFKNPRTKICNTVYTADGEFWYELGSTEYRKRYYTKTSVFEPFLHVKGYLLHTSYNNSEYEYYKFSHTYNDKIQDGTGELFEYYNTPSGRAVNHIFTTTNETVDYDDGYCPEQIANNTNTDIYNTQLKEEDIPSYTPDITPPEISSVILSKPSGEGFNVTNNKNAILRITINVTDDFSPTDKIALSLQKKTGNDEFTTIVDFEPRALTYFDISSERGNGQYKVIAKDQTGNKSEKAFNVTAWDFEKPFLETDITPTGWSISKKLKILTNDGVAGNFNVALLDKDAYFFEKETEDYKPLAVNKIAWNSTSEYEITENGMYHAYVRDAYGNMTDMQIEIKDIDSEAPFGEPIVTKGEGDYAIVGIKAYDKGASGLKVDSNANYICFQKAENEEENIEFENPILKDGYLFTSFLVYKNGTYTIDILDNAGNRTTLPIDVDLETMILEARYGSNAIEDIKCENTEYGTEYPHWTGQSIQLTGIIKNDIPLANNPYCWDEYEGAFANEDMFATEWDKTGSWSGSPTLLVEENGSHTLYVRTRENIVYRKTVTINTIDKDRPILSAKIEEDTLIIKATDEGKSGIEKIWIDGGTLESIKELTFGYEKEVNKAIALKNEGTYKIHAVDAAGNKSDTITKIFSHDPNVPQDPPNKPNNGDLYRVDFIAYGDAILKSQMVKYGEDATPPENPVRDGYIFTGWSKSYCKITEDTTIKAVWLEKASSSSATPTPTPSPTATPIPSQTITPSVTPIPTQTPTVTPTPVPTVTPTPIFNVYFKNYNGAVIKSQTVEKGKDATPPTNPKREGYTFSGWNNGYTNIQSDTNVTAVFVKNEKTDMTSTSNTPNNSNNTGSTTGSSSTPGTTFTPSTPSTSNGGYLGGNTGSGGGYTYSGGSSGYRTGSGTGTTGTTTSKVGETKTKSVSKNSTDKSLKDEATKKENADKETDMDKSEETSDERYVSLDEFSKSAILLPLSDVADDNKSEEISDEEFVKQSFDVEIEDDETEGVSTNATPKTDKASGNKVGAILILVGIGAAIVFYFLNKKYYWINLPF